MAQITLKIKLDIPGLQAELDKAIVEIKQKLSQFGTVDLKADHAPIDAAKESLDDVDKSLKKVTTDTEKTNAANVDSASKWGMISVGVQSAFQAVGQFVGSMEQLLGQSVKGAAELSVLRANFKGNAEDLELFRKAVAGTVSDAGLIKLSNRATDLKMSMEDQAIAFSFAEDAADKYGGSVEDNFNKIVNASEGMGRGLKEIGIETKVYQENLKNLVKEHGGSLDKLDAETQKTIMLKATIQSLGLTLEDVKKKQKDENDLIESMSVSVEEARIKLGSFLLKGLVPVLKTFDESGETVQGFITGIIAIGGTLIQAIPLVVQLYTAKKIFTAATLASTTATAAETIATEANTVAKVANLSVLGRLTPFLAAIGTYAPGIAAAGVVVYSLSENIKSLDVKKVEDLAKAMDQLAKNKQTAESLGYSGPLNAPTPKIQSGKVDEKNLVKLTDQLKPVSPHLVNTTEVKKESAETQSEVDKIRARIKELQGQSEQTGLSLEQLFKITQEVTRLSDKLNPKTASNKDAEDMAKASLAALRDGKQKELAELDLWYAQELDKHKGNANWKFLVDEQYKDKKKTLEGKFSLEQFTIESDREKRYIDLQKDSLVKSIALINNDYFLKREKAKGNADELVLLEQERLDKIARATADYNKKELDADFVLREKKLQARDQSEQKEIDLLDLQMQKELLATNLTEEMKLAIVADYEQRKKELRSKNAEEASRNEQDKIRDLSSSYERHFGALVNMAENATSSQMSMDKQLKDYLLRQLKDYLVKYIATKIAEATVFNTTEAAKTAALAASTAAQAGISTTATAVSTATTVSSMGAITAAAAPAAAATSIATFGGSAWAGYAAIAAVFGLILGMIIGKKEGGYTGGGNPDEVAGTVHKEEYVFESDLVKGNVSKFDMLRNLLRSGVSIDQLYKNLSNQVNPVQLMPDVVLRTNLASSALRSGAIDSTSLELKSVLSEVKSVLADLKKDGVKANVALEPTKITEELKGSTIYRSYEIQKKSEDKRKS